jgi:hypothetical protein
VCIEAGDLDRITAAARENAIAVYVGVMERAADRGGHSVYASMVYVDANGGIGSVHRKLMPTYEERLVWAIGDGHGLRTHKLGPFTAGGPRARTCTSRSGRAIGAIPRTSHVSLRARGAASSSRCPG